MHEVFNIFFKIDETASGNYLVLSVAARILLVLARVLTAEASEADLGYLMSHQSYDCLLSGFDQTLSAVVMEYHST